MAPQGSPSPDDKDVERLEQVSRSLPQTSASGNGFASVDAGARAHEQALASVEADKNNSPSPSNTISPGGRQNAQSSEKEKDKDKGSLATTVQTHQNAPSTSATSSSIRRFSRKSKPASKATKSSTTSSASAREKAPPSNSHSRDEARSTKGSQKKESFISKLVRKLVPCVSDRTHAIEMDVDGVRHGVADVTNGRSAPTSDVSVAGEKQDGAKELEQEKEKPNPPVLDTSPSTIQANTAEAEVIVPPTPTKALLPISETEGVTSGAVQPPGSTGTDIFSPSPPPQTDLTPTPSGGTLPHAGDTSHTATDSEGSFTDDEAHVDPEEPEVEEVEPMEEDEDTLIMNGGAGIPIGPDGEPRPLLPPIAPHHAGRKCLVLDLDETLVHSSFKSIQHADYVVPVEIEYHWHNVYVIKRPGVDNFLKKMGEIYEVVVFTASLSKYADPVLDKLDIHQVVSHRLFRESCYNHKGNYVKDLSQLGRPIADTIILDNSPASYIFHPNNAVPVSSWFNDPHDTELTDLCPFLADLGEVGDVRGVLDGGL